MNPAPPQAVRIEGSGIGAACAARLLRARGIEVEWTPAPRRGVPAIMLGQAAIALLADVFGQPSLFADRPRIRRRVVRWGAAEAVAHPHDGVVVSEADLVAHFGLEPLQASVEPTFTLHAAAPFPSPDGAANTLQRFGARQSVAHPVNLAAAADRATCHVEATSGGWLFLVPGTDGQCWLLAIGAPADLLLCESRLVAPLVTGLGQPTPVFETAPGVLPRLAGPGWLACGMSALAFDPICGDGTAHAVREAILAAAVIGAIAEGGEPTRLTAHYEAMLIAGLRRHLQVSGQFYATGGETPWWQAQLAGVARGYGWCTRRLATTPPPAFALHGDRLVPLEAAA